MIIISCTIISRDDVEVDFHGTSLEHEGQRGQHACSTRCLTIRKMLGKRGRGGEGGEGIDLCKETGCGEAMSVS